jgi:hypothetical protein
MSAPYLHCQCGHSIYAHYPTGQCDNPGCSRSCADTGFEQCDCNGEKNR